MAHKKLACYLKSQKIFIDLVVPQLHSLKDMIKENLENKVLINSKRLVKVKFADRKASAFNYILLWYFYESFYKLLNIIVESLEKDAIDMIITEKIIVALILRISSDISYEKIEIVKILKLVYLKSIKYKDYVIKTIKNLLLSIIHEEESSNGCIELLDFIFNLIRDKNFSDDILHDFANEIFLPLHKVQSVILFHEQLKCLCQEYSKINTEFANKWISAIIRWWPYGNSHKELLFINELEIALYFSETFIAEEIAHLALIKLSSRASSPHDKISFKSLSLLWNQCSKNIISKYSESICIKLMKGMLQWDNRYNSQKNEKLYNSVRAFIFKKIPKTQYLQLSASESSLMMMHDQKIRKKSEDKWEVLLKKAHEINSDFTCPKLPYKETCIVGLNNMNKDIIFTWNLIPDIFLY